MRGKNQNRLAMQVFQTRGLSLDGNGRQGQHDNRQHSHFSPPVLNHTAFTKGTHGFHGFVGAFEGLTINTVRPGKLPSLALEDS